MDFAQAGPGHRRIERRAGPIQIQRGGATLYRFFWSEYCDWYLEAAKAALAAGNEAADAAAAALQANTLAVMDFVLSNTLRLFHPFLPFITEELWHGLGCHQDLPPDQGGDTIMFAHWPKALDADFGRITDWRSVFSNRWTRAMSWSHRAAICAGGQHPGQQEDQIYFQAGRARRSRGIWRR
jgi:isoleucyl-tRNA synthetase